MQLAGKEPLVKATNKELKITYRATTHEAYFHFSQTNTERKKLFITAADNVRNVVVPDNHRSLPSRVLLR